MTLGVRANYKIFFRVIISSVSCNVGWFLPSEYLFTVWAFDFHFVAITWYYDSHVVKSKM